MVNLTGCTQTIDSGTSLGTLSEIEPLSELEHNIASATMSQLVSTEELQERKLRLVEMIKIEDPELQEVILQYHHLFSVDEEERGETDLVQLTIDTGEASPIKQPARHLLFAARQEVARHLHKMQEANVI